MANKRIKRVIIAGAGFSAPAKLPIQSRIIDRMAEVPEMDFLTGKMPEESMTFLDAFITVGLFLLDNYAKKDYTEYRVKYQKLVDKDLAYRTFFGAQEIDFKSLWSEETSKTLSSIFSDEAAHSKHVSNYYSEVYSIRENIRKAIQDEKINVNLEDVFTAFDKSIIAREHLHGYTYAQMDKIRYSIMRLFIYYFSKSVLEHDFAHKDYQAFFGYLKKHRTIEPPTIITTNWDTLIESYCNKYSVDYSYGFLQPYTSDSIKHTAKNYDLLLLKIHGSANWLRCLNCGSISIFEKNHAATSLFEDNRTEKCPVCGHEKTAHGASMQPELITPTMMKSLSNQLYTNLWSSAAQELRDATHIIFVGYSLPIADFEFRYMLQKSVTSSAKIDVILTPNSNPDLVANNLKDLLPSKRYLDAFPKNKVSFYYEGFGPYFSLSK